MRRFLRYLRIAFSVTCGVVAVLLCVLWVRSWNQPESITRISGALQQFGLQSRIGVLQFWRSDLNAFESFAAPEPRPWKYEVHELIRSDFEPWFLFRQIGGMTEVRFPHWLAVLLLASIALCPWLPFKRFSLRTLLIVTTLVAVVLGLIVWTVR